MTSVLVPWNTCGAYISGVLGVSTASYLPYCFFNLLSPILDIAVRVPRVQGREGEAGRGRARGGGPAESRRRVSLAEPREATSVPVELRIELLVGFARVAHDAGYPTADLEERLSALATALGFEDAQVSATPTIVDVSLGAVPQQRTFSLRVRPTAVDLDAIARLDDLVQDILGGQVEPEAALARLAEVQTRPLVRPWPVRLGAYALAGAAVAPVLGGGWRETARKRRGRPRSSA